MPKRDEATINEMKDSCDKKYDLIKQAFQAEFPITWELELGKRLNAICEDGIRRLKEKKAMATAIQN